MNKPKIAVIGLKGLPAFGGAATVGENVIEELKHKYEFTVYSISSHTDCETGMYRGYKQIVWKKILVGKLNILYYYLISTFHCLLKHYDVIHLHHSVAGLFNIILRLKFKTVYTSHSTKVTDYFKSVSKLIKLSELIAFKYSSCATAVSKTTYDNFSKIRPNNINYIPNGINKIEIQRLPGISEKYFMFAAGRILPFKGLHLLLEALKENDIRYKLKIAGNIEIMPRYKKRIKLLTKNLNVENLGLIKDKQKLLGYIANADFFAYPSKIEAMSMMLLEVASVKTPLICSNIKENKDIFNEDEVLFFEVDNYLDLSEKIMWAINNPKQMKKKADRAFKKLSKKYLWEDIAKKYDELYENLLAVTEKI